jgi:ABC-type phosphate transport system substrate-binding protein
MWRHACLLLVTIAACGHPAPTSKPAAPHDPLADARAAELGRGVPRDYAAAARIYARVCDGGKGNALACRRYLRALLDARGVDVDKPKAFAIATELCLRTSDRLGCVIAAFSVANEKDLPPGVLRAIEASGNRDCDATHLDVCEVGIDLFGFNQSSSHEWAVLEFNVRACELDVVEMCTHVLDSSKASDEQRADARKQLTADCDLGDADACNAVPGREIAWRALCEAHDYKSCAFAACLGEPGAAQLAAGHRTDVPCREAELAEAARHPPPPPPPLPPLPVDPEPGTITPAATPPMRSLLFRQLGKRDMDGWQTFEIYNLSDRTVDGLVAYAYAYDASGAQVGRSEFPATIYGGLGLAPGAHMNLDFPSGRRLPDSAVAFDACYASIRFSGDPKAHVGRCPENKKRGETWGNGNDVVAVTVNNRSGTTYPGDFDRVLIDDFERTHAGVLMVSDPTSFLMPSVPIVISTSRPAADEVAKARGGPMISVPLMFTPVAVRYHLANIADLRLSAATLAQIFQREIKTWDAPAIAKDNPGVALPAAPIVVMRPSGADAKALIDYTRRAGASWHLDLAKPDPWPADTVYASTDDMLAKLLASTDGAIGLTTPRAAAHTDLPAARVRNGGRAWVAPSGEGATRAADAAGADYVGFEASSATAYPIVYVTWASTYAKAGEHDTGTWVKTFMTYLVGDGQAVIAGLGYGPVPKAAATRARAAIARVAVP